MERTRIIEYSENLYKFQNGFLTQDEWMFYCKEIFAEALEDAKNAMILLDNHNDKNEIR